MSFLHYLTVVSFHKYNPDWEIYVYVFNADKKIDDDITNPKYADFKGKDYWPDLINLGYVQLRSLEFDRPWIHSILISDIWRREILYEDGGVYSDFDMLWLRPMEDLANVDCLGDPDNFEGTVSFHELTHGFHNVSNIISERHSRFLKCLIDESRNISAPYGDQSFGTDLLNRMFPDWQFVVYGFPRMLALPYETFYPYSTFKMKKLFVDNDLSPLESKNVLGIHWFNGNPISKEFINNDAYDRDCSINTILKKEGYL